MSAEYIIANIVLLSRQIGDRSREIHAGTWNKVSKSCWEVRNKTLGIVGYGHVGSQLGVMAEALSLRVIFYDSVSLMPIGRAQPMDSLEGLLAESDFVSINVSKIPDNNNLFSKKEFAAMKKNASLINTSYGEAVDLEALKEAITSGHLHGAAIDVFPESVVASGSCCLQGVPKVILSHEAAHETEECHERIVGEVTHAIVQYLSIGTTVGAENYPSISAWPVRPGSRRIINVHKNVRGVLKVCAYFNAHNVILIPVQIV